MNGVEQAYIFSKTVSEALDSQHFLSAPFRPGCHEGRGAVRVLLPDGQFHTVKFSISANTDASKLARQIGREVNERQANSKR